jgi:hypothetical protein
LDDTLVPVPANDAPVHVSETPVYSAAWIVAHQKRSGDNKIKRNGIGWVGKVTLKLALTNTFYDNDNSLLNAL